MILSHKHKFIFIKTHMTAGTAIEDALAPLCGPDDILTPDRPLSESDSDGVRYRNFRIDHPSKPKRSFMDRLRRRPENYSDPTVGYYEFMPAWRIRQYAGDEVWNSYYKFAFDRHPMERQVAWYLQQTKSEQNPPTFKLHLESWAAYVENQKLYRINEDLAVDFLGRYETLEEDFKTALAGAGITEPVNLTNVESDLVADYRDYYTPRIHDKVARWYAPEAELLGYDL